MASSDNGGGFGGFQVDDDWKKQAQAEKQKLAEEAQSRRAAAPAAPTEPAATPAAQKQRPRRNELPDASFDTLVNTMASQVMLYLGGVAVNEGQGILDLDRAKHQLDLLALLEEKTEGNLSEAEKANLDATLYETRMRFVGTASRYIL